jgi:hypothetical protein
MNERIKELIKQATEHDYTTWDSYNQKELVYYKFNQEKFAELILQDIDKIVDELYHALPLEQAAVLLTLDENIKEHFYGIEE